jgi:branched-chain amino acid transport system substrate-binding protein
MRKLAFFFFAVCCLCLNAVAWAESDVEPLRIGLILDLAGPYAETSGEGSIIATKMAVDDFGGSVLGRRIKVVTAHHQNSLERAGSVARDWFDNLHVEAIMDVSGVGPALTVHQIAKARKKIAIFNSTGTWRLNSRFCAPYSVQYGYNVDSLLRSGIQTLTALGLRTWSIIEPTTLDSKTREHMLAIASVQIGSSAWQVLQIEDLAEGSREQSISQTVTLNGGSVSGTIQVALSNPDYIGALQQAQVLKPQAIAIIAPRESRAEALKQASALATISGQKIVIAPEVSIDMIHEIGLQQAQGVIVSSSFYWNLNSESQAWSRRFFQLADRLPSMEQAGAYSATMHYLKAVASAGTTKSAEVMRWMRENPINDFFVQNGRIRADGRMEHDVHVFKVKSPAESTGPWDYLQLLATVPAEAAFEPLSKSTCYLKGQISRPSAN